jgi:hypothetical protein
VNALPGHPSVDDRQLLIRELSHSISFIHEGREHVVFSTAQDKIAWLEPFVEMRASALNGIHGKITLAKWLDIDIKVGDGIPAFMNRGGSPSTGPHGL